MSNINNNSKYILKVVALIIVVIINVIAIIGVVSTVGKTVGDLKTNLAKGTISKEASGNKNEVSLTNEADENIEYEEDMDFGNLFKKAIKDKDVLKSIVLMAIALILLAGAVFVLIKLK